MAKKSQSLFEYMQSRGLTEATKVRITHNGKQTGLDDRSALMWWRHINWALKEFDNEHPNVFEARQIDANGNTTQVFLPGLLPTVPAASNDYQIQITCENHTLHLNGETASRWLAMVEALYQAHPVENKKPYEFREVQADGTLAPMPVEDLVTCHVWSTGFCSFARHMRSASSTYKDIIKLGTAALPAILTHLRNEGGGMNVMLLLSDITKESPYTPEQIRGTSFAKYKVSDYRQAWITWGIAKKYITP